MKKILFLLIVMTMVVTSFSLVAFAADTPTITMEYVEDEGIVTGTIYLIGNIATDFAGYSLSISWEPDLVQLAKKSGESYTVITADTDDFADKSAVGALANWGHQTTATKIATSYFQIGLKDLSSDQSNNIALSADTKLELAKVYFTLADDVETLEGETPFSSYVKTSIPAVTSQINYGVKGLTTIKTSASVNFFTFADKTDYTPVVPVNPGLEEVGIEKLTYTKDTNDNITINGTMIDVDADYVEAGVKFGTIHKFPALTTTGTPGEYVNAKYGKFTIIFEGLDHLPTDMEIPVSTYWNFDNVDKGEDSIGTVTIVE